MSRNRVTEFTIPAVAAIAVSALILTGGSPTPDGKPGGSAARPDAAGGIGGKISVELLKEPLNLPAFTLTDLDGKTMRSTDWHGKVVLLNFWATWCGPCRAEIPDLVALQDKYRDELVIVGISEDE